MSSSKKIKFSKLRLRSNPIGQKPIEHVTQISKFFEKSNKKSPKQLEVNVEKDISIIRKSLRNAVPMSRLSSTNNDLHLQPKHSTEISNFFAKSDEESPTKRTENLEKDNSNIRKSLRSAVPMPCSSSDNIDLQAQPKHSTQISTFFAKSDDAANKVDMGFLNNCTELQNTVKRKCISVPDTCDELKNNTRKASVNIKKACKLETAKEISKFFQPDNNESVADFQTPKKLKSTQKLRNNKPVPEKKLRRAKDKQPDIRKAINKNLSEEQLFTNALTQHSSMECLDPDQLQLALALSRSMADIQNPCDDPKAIPENQEEKLGLSYAIRNTKNMSPEDKQLVIKYTLNQFGFKPNVNKEYNFNEFFGMKKSKKEKWNRKYTPLTRRDPKVQEQKCLQKVQHILNVKSQKNTIFDEIQCQYIVSSQYLSRFFVSENILFSMNACESDTNIELFYTNNLFPVSTAKAGCLLKNWSLIPGRDCSPVRSIHSDIENNLEEQERELLDLLVCNDDVNANIPEKGVEINLSVCDGNGDKDIFNVDELETNLNIINMSLRKGIDNQCALDSLNLSRKFSQDDTNSVDDVCNGDRESSPDIFADYDGFGHNKTIIEEEEVLLLSTDTDTSHSQPIIKTLLTAEIIEIPSCSDETCQSSQTTETNELIKMVVDTELNSTKSSISDMESEMIVHEEFTSDEAKIDEHVITECTTVNKLYKTVDDVIEILSDDSEDDYNTTNKKAKENHKESIKPADIDLTDDGASSSNNIINLHSIKKLSLIQRFELYNNDPLFMIDNLPNENKTSANSFDINSTLSQESINISDDEVNYSMNYGKKSNIQVNCSSNRYSEDEFDIGECSVSDLAVAGCSKSFIKPISCYKSPKKMKKSSFNEEIPIASDYSFDSVDFNKLFDDNIESSQSNDILANENDMINQSIRDIFEKDFISNSKTPNSDRSGKFKRTTSDLGKQKCKSSKFLEFLDDSFVKTTVEFKEYDRFDELLNGTLTQPPSKLDLNKSKSSVNLSPSTEEFEINCFDKMFDVKIGNISPKPDYDNMDSPTRLTYLKKYGLKPLNKRKAIICLDHIYNRLHPFIENTENHNINNLKSDLSSEYPPIKTNSTKITPKKLSKNQKKISTPRKTPTKSLNLQSVAGSMLLDNSFVKFQTDNQQYFLPSMPRSKKPWCLQPLHIAWYNLIQANSNVFEQVLQYKPIDLKEIRQFFKNDGLLYDINDLIAFFDKHCITFQTENNRNKKV